MVTGEEGAEGLDCNPIYRSATVIGERRRVDLMVLTIKAGETG